MLRHAQHERKFINDFNTTSVRPELVEGGMEGFFSRITIQTIFSDLAFSSADRDS